MHTHRGRHASQFRYNGNCGPENGNAKLAMTDVRAIRERYAAGGITQRELAEEYGLARTYVGEILRYVTWKHV